MPLLPIQPLTWLITGTSSGFGLHLARSALAAGDRVIATGRPSHSFPQIKALESGNPGRCKALELDVCASEEVLEGVARDAVGVWGGVDVVVNNAGCVRPFML